jgi:arylsulfatase A-like enzyme
MAKPLSILWISFEDTSPRFGCYGDEVARTPNVDRLASQGCVYFNTFSTAGVCAPARSAIITGMYPTFIGAHHMRTAHTNKHVPGLPTPYDAVPPHYVKCFSEYLRAAGYYCTNNGKTDYQFTCPSTAWDANKAAKTLDEVHWRNRPDPDQPFFAVFNLQRTHESGQWEEKTPEITTDPDSVTLPPYLPDTLECRKALARQYENIAFNDGLVGTLLEQLEADGLADNTAVFIWSDHGEGLPRSKRWPYDSGIRVPGIVRWPGHVEPGSRCEDLISTIDLAPTVFSMLGMDIPVHLQGKAFLGEQAQPARESIFAARDRYDESYDMVRAVRTGQYKYIRNYHPELERLQWIPYRNRHAIAQEIFAQAARGELEGDRGVMASSNRAPEELYDIVTDPFEINNLAGSPEHAEALAELREIMDNSRAKFDRWGDIDEAQMVRSWWPDGEQPTTLTPLAIPLGPKHPGQEPASDGDTLLGPVLLQLYCGTQGASIAWTTDPADEPAWNLYAGPIRLTPGRHALRLKAVRIGHHESPEAKLTLTVK